MVGDIEVGALVVRKSYGCDIVFKVTDIIVEDRKKAYCTLKGLHLRLVADSPLDDLKRIDAEHLRDEVVRMECIRNESMRRVMMRRSREREHLERGKSDCSKKYSFFELPGRVLHIDGDEEYMKMCLKTYNQLNIDAVGRWVEECKHAEVITDLLTEFQPDILVMTGHDAISGSSKKDLGDITRYRNSKNFVQAVKKARLFEPSRDNLVIFAGACQSFFEAILHSGANFASSPNRIFIHAYDPVFIAEKIAFTPISKKVIQKRTFPGVVCRRISLGSELYYGQKNLCKLGDEYPYGFFSGAGRNIQRYNHCFGGLFSHPKGLV